MQVLLRGTVRARPNQRLPDRSAALGSIALQRFDVLVVGAGPAGATAAYRLATGAASVLLVDKARFPRDKPCGGGLTARAVKQLPFSVEPVVEDVVHTFELRLGYRSHFVRASDDALCFMTQRRRLDDFLARKAQEAGADFRDGTTLSLDDALACADYVVGADGVNGVTSRAVKSD